MPHHIVLKESVIKSSKDGGITSCTRHHQHAVRHYGTRSCTCSCHDTSTHHYTEPYFDPEVNFRTHPFLNQLVEELDADSSLVYSISKDGRPVAVVISPILLETLNSTLQMLTEQSAERSLKMLEDLK